ncbi:MULTISPECIES: S-layer protein [unclassified Microcoleus]|uniref:S-layer protein n=1 Tax=unclassified Microcoleus TaxID=2642155 RepID=UPI002FCE7812
MVKLRIVSAAILLISASCSSPALAQNPAQPKQNNSLVQVQPTQEQILNACVQNQVETLPNPFTDVPSNHWAYKAVLTMYYCGAYREGTPPALIKELLESGPPIRESSPSRAPFPNFPLQPFPVIN